MNPNKDSEESPTVATSSSSSSSALEAAKGSEKADGDEEEAAENGEDPMEEDQPVNPAAVFCIRLKQPRSNLMHKMSVPELCRNFSAVAWCGKLNAIACASETCARIPSSNANPPFWIPIHIVIPERPTECVQCSMSLQVLSLQLIRLVLSYSPRDSVQFMEWSPTSCPRALLIANFHGRITIWTQPSQSVDFLGHLHFGEGLAYLIWSEMQVAGIGSMSGGKTLQLLQSGYQGVSPYRWLSSRSSNPASSKSTFEEKFLSQQPQAPGLSFFLLFVHQVFVITLPQCGLI
ncbi:sensitive to freezing 6 [Actinidia rufa]|uniref:Sensitive to freezing 6 n=1 Tax=Actinidia rufa TaxID=165716 RepID=A0A7J0EZJ3_9ERIC|nr:sensitive to freezing 6 [Actinidia rufa]